MFEDDSAVHDIDHPFQIPMGGFDQAADGDPLRTFYAFDPARQAVLLIGGSKAGDEAFYTRLIPACERIWREYLAETRLTRSPKM